MAVLWQTTMIYALAQSLLELPQFSQITHPFNQGPVLGLDLRHGGHVKGGSISLKGESRRLFLD